MFTQRDFTDKPWSIALRVEELADYLVSVKAALLSRTRCSAVYVTAVDRVRGPMDAELGARAVGPAASQHRRDKRGGGAPRLRPMTQSLACGTCYTAKLIKNRSGTFHTPRHHGASRPVCALS